MARPKKNNADYFSHDADMRNDPKLKALRRKYGLEGYAIWCFLLEVLTDADYFEYKWNDLNIELLAGDFDIEPDRLNDFVQYLQRLELITIDENQIMRCNRLIERFEPLLSKRKRDRSRVFADENPQSKVKESKVKERKEKESNIPTPSKIGRQHIENLAKEHGLDLDYVKVQTNLAKEYYEEKDRELTPAKLDAWLSKDSQSKKNPSNPNRITPPYHKRLN